MNEENFGSELTDRLGKTYFFTALIGVLLLISLFFFMGLVEYIKREYYPFEGFSHFADMKVLRLLLFGVSVLLFALVRIHNKSWLSKKVADERVVHGKPAHASLIRRLLSLSILSYVLCEAMAVIGVFLFLAAGRSSDFYILMILSFSSFIIHFPRYRHWERWIRKQERPSH